MRETRVPRLARLVWPLVLGLGLTLVLLWGVMPRLGAQAQVSSASTGEEPSVAPRPGIPMPLPEMPAVVRHDLWHLSSDPQSVGRLVRSPYVMPVGQSVRLPYTRTAQSGPLAQPTREPAWPVGTPPRRLDGAGDQSPGSSYASSTLPPPYRPVSTPPVHVLARPAQSPLSRASPTPSPLQIEPLRSKPVAPPAAPAEPALPQQARLAATAATDRAQSLSLSAGPAAGHAVVEASAPFARESLAALTPPMPGTADLAICLETQRVWGVVAVGETVTVTVNGVQMGAAWADGKGFFWTTLYDANGQRPGLKAGDVVAIYHNGALAASVTLRSINGHIDVMNDTVSGTIGGSGHPLSVTVYTAGAEPVMVSADLTVNTDPGGDFVADFSGIWDFVVWDEAQVAYSEGGVEVHQHVHPRMSLLVRPSPLNSAFGYAIPGGTITATVYLSDLVTVKASANFTADAVTGWYFWDPSTDLEESDIVVIELPDGAVLSRTIDPLSIHVDAANDRITGVALPGATVRWRGSVLTPQGGGNVHANTQADAATGVYTLELGTVAGIRPPGWSGISVADAEGDDLNVLAGVPSVDVNQTTNSVSGYASGLPGPQNEGQPVTLTLHSAGTGASSTYLTTSTWWCWYEFGTQKEAPLPDIAPGDVVTVETASWQGVVLVRNMTVQHDLVADQFSGTVEPPSNRVELSAWHWQRWVYPVGGAVEMLVTASSAWIAAPAGFDLYNDLAYDVAHRTADEYVERIHGEPDWIGVIVPKSAVQGVVGPPGTAYTVTLYDGMSNVKAQVTGTSGDPLGGFDVDFRDAGQRTEFGDRVQVESAAGFNQTVVIPELTIQGDPNQDTVYGQGPANALLYVEAGGQGNGFVPTDDSGHFVVGVNQLQNSWGNGDLQWGDYAWVESHDEHGNWVWNDIRWQFMSVSYAHDWMLMNYPAGHTFWITVTDGSGVVKASATADTAPSGGWNGDGLFVGGDQWLPAVPDIQPGDWVYARADDGYYKEVHVGTITGALDVDDDSVSGNVYAQFSEMLPVKCQVWDEKNTPDWKSSTAAPDGSVPYFCQWDPGSEWDVKPGQNIAVAYVEPDGDWVIDVFRQPRLDLIMTVNYAHDWVQDNYEEVGHTIWLTVTSSDGVTVKARAMLMTQVIPEWKDGIGFSTNLGDPWVPSKPDLQAGDWVYGAIDNGYSGSVHIGTITGVLDADADTISGTIQANWFTEMLNGNVGIPQKDAPGMGFSVDPDGGSYFWDIGAAGWDLQPGQDVNVSYWEPDGDEVRNVFREPAPDLRVEKWREGNEAAPGGTAVFGIRYRNEGDAVAATIWLTDTLPGGTSYVADGSGVPANIGAGWVSWTLGPLNPGEERQFHVVLANTASPSDTLRNVADGFTLYDCDPGDNHAEADIHVGEGQPDVYVNKWVHPGDPTPGQTFLYGINYGNNGPVASGPVVMTDTLPQSTTLVSWRSENGYSLWQMSVVSDQLVWTAPSIPGNWGDNMYLRLRVDDDASLGTQLVNAVEISTVGDTNPDNNTHVHADARVSGPRLDGRVEKVLWYGRLVPGGELAYLISLGNNGNVRTDVFATDTLPAGTSFLESWINLGGPRSVPFPPTRLEDAIALWDFGTLEPGDSHRFWVRATISNSTAPGTVITNCIETGMDGPEGSFGDRQSCVSDMVNQPGPNLRLRKTHWWEGQGQLQYQIHYENVGTVALESFCFTDTYPLYTTWDGNSRTVGPWVNITHDSPNRHLVFCMPQQFYPGTDGTIEFGVNLQPWAVGRPGMTFTNTVQATIPGDVYPDDNYAEVVARTSDLGFAVGLVLDGPTVAEPTFSGQGYQALLRAQGELGIIGAVYTSTSPADWATIPGRCADDGNDLCISIGWPLADGTWSAAEANPDVGFAIADHSWDGYPANLRGMVFADDEASYLAGTLAGLMTQSGVVAVIGGMQIPAVEPFVEGYRNGARCANPQSTVLVRYAGTFTDPSLGAQIAQEVIAGGADVIFAPAGPTGAGAVLYATQAGIWGIGVDSDWYLTIFANGTVAGSDKLLSSAVKRVDNAVFDTIRDAFEGSFSSGTVLYNLASEGVELAPFHEADPFVPQSVRDALEAVTQGIISGAIDVHGACAASVLRFDPPSAEVRECVGAFTMDAYVEDVTNLGGFQFVVTFDPSVLHAEAIGLGSFITESGRMFMAMPEIDNAAGTVGLAGGVFGPGPELSGSGPVARITFVPVSAGASDLSWSDVLVTDPDGLEVYSVAPVNGSVTVLAALPGDMDCDCDVDIVDIMLVASRWNTRVGNPRYDPRYDWDSDGDIDIVDIMRVASRWNTHCEEGLAPEPQPARVGGRFADEAPPEGVRITGRPKGALRDDSYTVEIKADRVSDLGGFELALQFNPKLLQVEDVELGELLGSTGRTAAPLDAAIDNKAGVVRFAAFSYGEARGADGSGVLARITLRALTASGGKLTVSSLQLTDTQGRVQ